VQGLHVVITGGSSGIGMEVARLCVERGAKVSILARDKVKLEAAKKVIEEGVKGREGVQIKACSVDCGTDYERVDAAIRSCCDDFGPCDAVVCCAGTSSAARFEEIDVAEFDKLFNANVITATYAARACYKIMLVRAPPPPGVM
jgi:3-dehydrosphinganine reductase